MATYAQFRGLEGYDVVGWDPRGTGGSTPVDCGDGTLIDALLDLDATPETPEEIQALYDGWKDFGQACLERSGALLAHISTLDTVHDMDLLRTLLGEEKLHFLGYSYGTMLGAVYAQTYPSKVGRMVLDSATNITDDESITQMAGFDLALNNYATWCVSDGCPLGASVDEVLETIVSLLVALDSEPLVVGNRMLTENLAVWGIALYLYFDESQWPSLTASIQWAMDGQGRYLLAASDALWGRDDTGHYSSFVPFQAITCLDYADAGIAGAQEFWEQEKGKSFFGYYFGIDASCAQWPVQPVELPQLRGVGAAPILIVGATGDSATPYEWAVWMANQLESGTLLTYDGPGHATSFTGRSKCVDTAVARFLTGDRIPPHGLYCT
jgi:pimeloyl-ACP methyl ester carboxylesterase